ncbi:MAG: hypothetical protein MJE63_00035, partial [Proteobacteria bacterium]|nr:hypothetical protein [Pseudomonadota bacterium]
PLGISEIITIIFSFETFLNCLHRCLPGKDRNLRSENPVIRQQPGCQLHGPDYRSSSPHHPSGRYHPCF